jgi:hypothetical protein
MPGTVTPIEVDQYGQALNTENLATQDNYRNCEDRPKLPWPLTVITSSQPARFIKILSLNANGGMRKETSTILSQGSIRLWFKRPLCAIRGDFERQGGGCINARFQVN